MKITSVDLFAPSLGTPAFHPVICRINTDEGIYGYGEAGIAFGVGANAAFGMLKDYSPLILGMDPMDNEVIWEKLFKTTFWGQGGGGIIFAGISAIDIALMDIKGKALGVPVYKLLGGKFRSELRCYASQLQAGWKKDFQAASPEDYARCALDAVEDGYDAIKIDFLRIAEDGKPSPHDRFQKILTKENRDMIESRVRAVREAIGPGVELILENHAATNSVSGEQMADLCEKYDILFLEEAATPLIPEMHQSLASRIKIPVATGERIYSRWGFAQFVTNRAVQLIQPDIGNCGGLSEAKKICDMAHVYDISMQAHVWASPILIAAALHLETAVPNFLIHETHRGTVMSPCRDLCEIVNEPVNGITKVSESPGIGNELSDFAISRSDRITVK